MNQRAPGLRFILIFYTLGNMVLGHIQKHYTNNHTTANTHTNNLMFKAFIVLAMYSQKASALTVALVE